MNSYLKLFVFISSLITTVENLQNDFKLTSEFASLTYLNKEFVSADFKFYKLNRTIGAASVSFTTKFIVDENLKVRVKLLQFRSNEYRTTIAELGISVCSVLNNDVIMNAIDLSAILKHTNVTQCPMKPGFYYINRISPRADGLPPLIPSGRYKAIITFVRFGEVTMATVEWLAKVDYKLKM